MSGRVVCCNGGCSARLVIPVEVVEDDPLLFFRFLVGRGWSVRRDQFDVPRALCGACTKETRNGQ